MNPSIKAALAVGVKGFCMGAADIVPGVSGSTMAFVLGIYKRFIDSISSFDKVWLTACIRLDYRVAITRPHLTFITPLVVGIFLAVFFFTHIVPIPRLLETHPEQIYGLFFGLITGSIMILINELGNINTKDLFVIVVGLSIGLVVITTVPTVTPDAWWFIMLSGTLSVCAMLVPGISGSFVLLLLGKYAHVLNAIGNLDFTILTPFILGVACGLFSFARLVSWLLRCYRRTTLLSISGVLVASLWVIWPFQQRGDQAVSENSKIIGANPVFPDFSVDTLMVLALFMTGCTAVVTLHRLAAEQPCGGGK